MKIVVNDCFGGFSLSTEEDKHILTKRIAMAYVAGAEDEQRRIARNVTSLIGLDSDVIFVE